MIGSHPGGQEMTARLLTLSGLRPPARILELGAGEGKTAAYLRTLGFEVRAVDLKPSGPGVEQGADGDYLGSQSGDARTFSLDGSG